MRIKTILSLITFTAAFVLSVSLVGLPQNNFYSRLAQINRYEQNRQNIQTLLQQDINNGRLRNQTVISLDGIDENFQSSFNVNQIAEATEEYVDASQSMDSSNLPEDFQEAWQAHMSAWREQADYLNKINTTAKKYPSLFENKKLNGYLFKLDSETYSSRDAEINRTWYEVLRVGRKYGVYVPVE
ncbi:MAG: hypothetical protein ACR2N3_13230 [Pyrinomonadaceae bacterium]